MGAVKQFLGDAIWGELDYLMYDLPLGTSDETLDIFEKNYQNMLKNRIISI